MSKESAQEVAGLFDEHVWDVYGYVAYRLGNRSDAEDLTQQTFERALRSWHLFDHRRASARTWLLAIARNLITDHYRRDRSNLHSPIGEETGSVSESRLPAHQPPDPPGLSPGLAAAIEVLSERDREIVALRFGGDLRGPEIAEMLGLELANVQQILSRSLRRMRTELDSAGRREAAGAERP